MIKDEIIAKRYADAFLGYAKETIGFEEGIKELQNIKHLLRDSPDFKHFLESLDITDAEKFDLIDKALADGFPREIKDFLKLLIDKGRISKFNDIAEFARIAYSHGVEIEALLKVSFPLDTKVIKRVKDALEKKLDRKLHMYVELDSNLLGGIYARIGNIVIDGSGKKRLEDMREKLTALKVV